MVYAIDMPSSFKSISENYSGTIETTCDRQVIKVIAGNKCDKDTERRKKKQDLDDLAEELGVNLFFETSAYPEYKDTIEVMFNAIIEELAKLPDIDPRRSGIVNLEHPNRWVHFFI